MDSIGGEGDELGISFTPDSYTMDGMSIEGRGKGEDEVGVEGREGREESEGGRGQSGKGDD